MVVSQLHCTVTGLVSDEGTGPVLQKHLHQVSLTALHRKVEGGGASPAIVDLVHVRPVFEQEGDYLLWVRLGLLLQLWTGVMFQEVLEGHLETGLPNAIGCVYCNTCMLYIHTYHTYIHICTYVRTHKHTHTHTHTHRDTHTERETHTHTRTYTTHIHK